MTAPSFHSSLPHKQQQALTAYSRMLEGRSLKDIPIPTLLQATDVAAKYKETAVGLDAVGYGFWTMLPIEIGLLLWRTVQRADILDTAFLEETPVPVDLTVFIPKYEGADTPDPFRPLQLPDAIRRKQQDLLVVVAAPMVYQALSVASL